MSRKEKLLTKKKLCSLLGTEQKLSLYMLRKHFFTDEILESLSITKAEYAKIKVFNFEQTRKIKILFAEDLKNVF